MKLLRSILAIISILAVPAVKAVEKRAEAPPVAGVPAIYWPLFRGGLTEDEAAEFRATLPYESITLERTPCYGACPVYTVTFHRTGKAELHAVRNLPKSGDFVSELDALSYGRLCYVLDHFRFRDLEASYQPAIRWTDDTTCIVTARSAGQNAKKVSDYGTVGPIELWTIQQLIDGFRERCEWKPK